MKLYWQEGKTGQRLMFSLDDGEETNVGTVRQTRRGFDALAVTTGYDPGRAQKGFGTIEEAKAFVEEFHPWDMFGGDFDLVVDPVVRPNPEAPETVSGGSSEQGAEAAGPRVMAEEAASPTAVAEEQAAIPEPPTAALDPTAEAVGPAVVAEERAAAPEPPTAALDPPAAAPRRTNVEASSPRKPWWKFW